MENQEKKVHLTSSCKRKSYAQLNKRYRLKENGKLATGCLPKFTDPEKLQEKVNEYFLKCDNNKITKYDEKNETVVTVDAPLPYTVTGLACHIGVVRETLYDWQKNNKILSSVIKNAKQRIEDNLAMRALLNQNNPNFTQFLMKNWFKYADKQEIHQKLEPVSPEKKKEKLEAVKRLLLEDKNNE